MYKTKQYIEEALRKIVYTPRFLHWLYAEINGYFWLPCPICGKCFGGHEWIDGNSLRKTEYSGAGVCPKCGEKARDINEKKFNKHF